MMGKTHIAIGLAAATFIPPVLKWPGLDSGILPFAVSVGAVALGSLAPDLDQPGSTLTRKVTGPFGKSRIAALIGGIVAIYIGSRFNLVVGWYNYSQLVSIIGIMLLILAFIKHRGVTHSLVGIAVAWQVVTVLQGMTLYQQYVGVPVVKLFMVGYVAHVVADFFSSSGIAPLYPIIEARIRLPVGVETGGLVDKMVVRYLALILVIARVFGLPSLSSLSGLFGPILSFIGRG